MKKKTSNTKVQTSVKSQILKFRILNLMFVVWSLMFKTCVHVVFKVWKSWLKFSGLYPLYTGRLNYLTSQVFFVRSLCTALKQPVSVYEQSFWSFFNLLTASLCPLSTPPMNTTNLIKE